MRERQRYTSSHLLSQLPHRCSSATRSRLRHLSHPRFRHRDGPHQTIDLKRSRASLPCPTTSQRDPSPHSTQRQRPLGLIPHSQNFLPVVDPELQGRYRWRCSRHSALAQCSCHRQRCWWLVLLMWRPRHTHLRPRGGCPAPPFRTQVRSWDAILPSRGTPQHLPRKGNSSPPLGTLLRLPDPVGWRYRSSSVRCCD